MFRSGLDDRRGCYGRACYRLTPADGGSAEVCLASGERSQRSEAPGPCRKALTFGRSGRFDDGHAADTDVGIELLAARRLRRESVMREDLRSAQATIGCFSDDSVISDESSGDAVTSRSPSNELSSSEKLVVELFMAEVESRQRDQVVPDHDAQGDAAGITATAPEDPWTSSQSLSAAAGGKEERKLGASAFLAPSTMTFGILSVVLTSNVLLGIEYYRDRTLLFLATLGIMHIPSVMFFVIRVYFILARSTVTDKFMRVLVVVWYAVTLPLLHLLPLLTLSSAMFDKAMMILGDPSDMRQFIRRQEEVAFEDLVWVAVTHCFPQAVLQLYLLFFRPNFVLILHEYEAILQLVSGASCTLLIACVATFYSKYVHVRTDEETDESTTYETVIDIYDDSGATYFLKFVSWCFIVIARTLALATLLSVYMSPALMSLAFLHVPAILLWSTVCRTTYDAGKFFGDLALGLITTVFVLDYRSLRREGLATAISAVMFLCAVFLEDSVCLALAYFLSKEVNTIFFAIIGAHYVSMTCGVFLLLCHFKLRSHKAEYAF